MIKVRTAAPTVAKMPFELNCGSDSNNSDGKSLRNSLQTVRKIGFAKRNIGVFSRPGAPVLGRRSTTDPGFLSINPFRSALK